jgi:deoxyribodipyrimidine photolyase-related protein
VHREFFLSNPRLGMLVRMYDKMDFAKRKIHLDNAEEYLKSLVKTIDLSCGTFE